MTTQANEKLRQRLELRRSELVGMILGLEDRVDRPTESEWRAGVAAARDCSQMLEQVAPKAP